MGSDIGQWILIGIGVAFIAFDKARKWFGNGKKNGSTVTYKYNPHPPGEAPRCQENRDLLMKLQTKVEGIEKDIDEIKRMR